MSGGYVLNALNRFKPQPSPSKIETPESLKLKEEPKADVARYDLLLKKFALAALITLPVLIAGGAELATEAPYGAP